jgi:hypothetical protein
MQAVILTTKSLQKPFPYFPWRHALSMPFGTHIAFLYGCATYANILDVVTQFQSVPVTLHLYGLLV